MSDLQFEYLGQAFYPRANSTPLILFAAPAGDIRSWAGVPRKAFDYLHGFQRSLNEGRVTELANYFLEDSNNISPTSVVVGLSTSAKLEWLDAPTNNERQRVARLTIVMPDLEEMSIEDIIDRVLIVLKERISVETLSQVDSNLDKALEEAQILQDQEAVDAATEFDSFPNEADQSTDAVPARSYLADFYAQLSGYANGKLALPEERPLREILYSFLKPAIIVDGQHRVFGAATVDPQMMLAVCAMPDSSWVENVYQFVLINQKAKPIKPAFLSSIIATSLSTEEIQSVYDRLRASKIDVERAEDMERMNTSPDSPFRDMVDFEVENSPGFLQYPGMSRLLKDFQRIDRTRPVLLPHGSWDGVTGDAIDHFFAMWSGVRHYFVNLDPRLWQEPSRDNPNNLLKIVTLQELQSLMLDNWADSRALTFGTPAQTRDQANKFWFDFPSSFFTDEWKKKGLQTSVGRRMIRDAITETRRNVGRRNWGHRRLGLFSD